jgi:peptide/nickel transport system permease protein
LIFYVMKRLLYVVPIAIGVSIVCFSLVHMAPGDVLSAVVPADAPQVVVNQLRHDYGLDRSLPMQYLIWLMRALHGDLGVSIASGRPVLGEITRAFANTFMLAILAACLGFTIGTVLGSIAGYAQGTLRDKLVTGIAVTGVSVPHYWLAIVMVIIFSANLNWLPAVGMGPGGSGDWAWDWLHLRHVILPTVTLAAVPMGIVTRSIRALVAEILNQDFVEALRAKGLGEVGVFLHVAKNVAPTGLAVLGLQLGYLLGGSILVETVFSWPGTGFLMNSAISQRDLPLLQGCVLVLAMFFVTLNLIVDVLQTALDPRVSRS